MESVASCVQKHKQEQTLPAKWEVYLLSICLFVWAQFGGEGTMAILVNPGRYDEKLIPRVCARHCRVLGRSLWLLDARGKAGAVVAHVPALSRPHPVAGAHRTSRRGQRGGGRSAALALRDEAFATIAWWTADGACDLRVGGVLNTLESFWVALEK